MLQCVEVRCCVLQCVAVCCRVLQGVVGQHILAWCRICSCRCVHSCIYSVAVWFTGSKCVAVCYSALQCVAVYCSALQCDTYIKGPVFVVAWGVHSMTFKRPMVYVATHPPNYQSPCHLDDIQIHTCVYIYTYVHTYTHMHIYIHIYTYI